MSGYLFLLSFRHCCHSILDVCVCVCVCVCFIPCILIVAFGIRLPRRALVREAARDPDLLGLRRPRRGPPPSAFINTFTYISLKKTRFYSDQFTVLRPSSDRQLSFIPTFFMVLYSFTYMHFPGLFFYLSFYSFISFIYIF